MRFSAFFTLLAIIACPLVALAADAPSFNRDIKPILSKNCFACHGPDEKSREADLRLDTFEGATADLLGNHAIVPGQPGKSEMIARITSTDRTERMPPRKTGKTLSPQQIDLLRKWIESGAKYEKHWAFVPPVKPALPVVQDKNWPRNGIDAFILAKLEKEHLKPSPEADPFTLVRRVYLDLIGLPPTAEEADAFVKAYAVDPAAYERLVDHLLAMPAYGERWATPWLDLARYADTNGYEKDRPRSIWPYRDWVIQALNADMPFDQFTIAQLAGDMLAERQEGTEARRHEERNNAQFSTQDTGLRTQDSRSLRIATGFHRNTMLNEEGGIDPLEYRFYAMVDRVATTGTVWLGLSTGCAQCHTHKYDPITHTDYYRLMALLNNADEPDLIIDRGREGGLEKLNDDIESAQAKLVDEFPPLPGEGPVESRRKINLSQKFTAWIDAQRKSLTPWRIIRPSAMESNLPRLEMMPDGSIFSTGDITKRDVFTLTFKLDAPGKPLTALSLEAMPDERLPAGGPGRCYYEGRKGDFFLSELTATLDGQPVKLTKASHTYGKNGLGSGNANAENVLDGEGSTGWATADGEGETHQLVVNFEKPIDKAGELKVQMIFERHYAASLGRFRFAVTSAPGEAKASKLPVELSAVLALDTGFWTNSQWDQVQRYFLMVAPEMEAKVKPILAMMKSRYNGTTTLVMQERPEDNPRPTFRHHRGEYLQTREEVKPALMSMFADSGAEPVTDRLALARWLVSEKNPLVGRVTVNRAWAQFFGRGIVETLGDFGTQGAPPTHPDLLDWLAVRFIEDGWSMKKLHRLIVTSATYRQASVTTTALLERDPLNELLARGPRFRMTGEMIRDSALKASGLLTEKLGGPSVYPPQPPTVTALAYGNGRWPVSKGPDRYRRSLYTFSKRTAPFAAYLTFDGPTGENCIVQRDRSNSPLQSLTLLNDEMFLEMARALALDVLKDQTNDREQAQRLWRRVMIRPADADELDAMLAFHAQQLARLKSGELKSAEIVAKKDATPQQAAWVMLARVILNLDEAVTKP